MTRRRSAVRWRGGEEEPAVYMESVHHILKLVAGVPNQRPVWFFDVAQQGKRWRTWERTWRTLAQWTLFPEQAIDYRSEIRMVGASRWPTPLTAAQFRQVTWADRRSAGLLPQYAP